MRRWVLAWIAVSIAASLAGSRIALASDPTAKSEEEKKKAVEASKAAWAEKSAGAKAKPAELQPSTDAAAKAASGGRLSVAQEVVDVGDVVRGKVAEAVFVLKNTGTETLKILSAKPG